MTTTPAQPPAAEPLGAEMPPRGRGMSDAVLSFLLTLVVGLVSAVVVSRLYGVVVIGEYALVAAPFALVSQFSNVGEHQALVRALAHESPRSTRAASMFVVMLGFSSGLTLLVAALAAPLAVLLLRATGHPTLVGPALVLLLAYVLLGNPTWNCDNFQVAFRGTRALVLGRFFDVAFLLLASVVLAGALRADVGALVTAQALTMGLALVLRVLLLRPLLTGTPTRPGLRAAVVELRELVRFGIRLAPGAAAQAVTLQAGTWIIGAVRPLAVLGAYSRANNLANRLTEAGYRLGEVLLPALARDVQAGAYGEAVRRFARWRLYVVLALVGASAALAGTAPGLLAVFGPGFAQAAVPLALLVAGYATGVVTAMHAQFLVALEAPGTVSRLALLRAALTLGSVAPLTIAYGATGAAASLLLGFAVEGALAVLAVGRRLRPHGVRDERPPWGVLVLAALACAGVGRLVDSSAPGFVGGLLGAAAGLACYAAALAVAGLLPVEALRRRLGRPSTSAR